MHAGRAPEPSRPLSVQEFVSVIPYRTARRISACRGVDAGQVSEALRGVTVAGDRLYTVGDQLVQVLTLDGRLVQHWRTDRPGYTIAVDHDGTLWVGAEGQIEIFGADGRRRDLWRDPQRLGLVTCLGFTADEVLVGEVKDRCIRRFDRQRKHLGDIGTDNRQRGFLLLKGHMDFVVTDDGHILAANPGKHRVERYDLDGKRLGFFGRFDGRDPAGFTSCCNPTDLALLPGGRLVTIEKADPRVKIYDAENRLVSVMGVGDFDLGCLNMDAAIDAQGRIYVIDTVRLQIVVFEPVGSPASQPTTAPAEVKP